jgi:hypothetical protein
MVGKPRPPVGFSAVPGPDDDAVNKQFVEQAARTKRPADTPQRRPADKDEATARRDEMRERAEAERRAAVDAATWRGPEVLRLYLPEMEPIPPAESPAPAAAPKREAQHGGKSGPAPLRPEAAALVEEAVRRGGAIRRVILLRDINDIYKAHGEPGISRSTLARHITALKQKDL